MAKNKNGSKHTPTFLRELYNPPGMEPIVDIVFVHGLNPLNAPDFAEKTWTHESGTLWPRDLLPLNVPECRVLLFGYNSNVAFDVSNQGIKDHANTLLDRFVRNRKSTEKSKTRPIIFVGHSLGGLVIKQALINATNNYEEYEVIKEATRGLVFFGTPHRGGNGVSLGQVAANIIIAVSGTDRNDILKSLSSSSILTRNSNDDFRHQYERYRVLTFYETRKTKVDKWPSGIFGCIFNAIVVDADSAKLGLAGARENQLPIDADHSGICRFESVDDDRYEPVGGLIEELVSRIIQDIGGEESAPNSRVTASKILLTCDRLDVKGSPNFSGREDEIRRIHEHLTPLPTRSSRRVVLLHGLGGIGKTEIALAYASRHRDEYTAVFWIDATSRQTAMLGHFQIVQKLIDSKTIHGDSIIGYKKMAQDLGLSGLISTDGLLISDLGDDDKERVLKTSKRLLEREENRNVLIIYDNCDDIESYKLFADFVPDTGSILVTSRRKEAIYLHGTTIEIEGVEEKDGIQLLLSTSQYLGSPGPWPDNFKGIKEVKMIVNILERLPLAIEIAGSYISRTRLSPRQFLSTLKNHKSRILQETPRGALERYGKDVYTSWDMSFNDLQDKNPDAIKLLRFCSFMHYSEISLELLRRGHEEEEDEKEAEDSNEDLRAPFKWLIKFVGDDLAFQKAIADLFSYSLARPKNSLDHENDIVFSIHPLVHSWSYEKLGKKEKGQYFISTVLLLGSALDLPNTTESLIAQRKALPHLESCFRYSMPAKQVGTCKKISRSLIVLGDIINKLGSFELRGVLEYILYMHETIFGLEHPGTLRAIINLASLLHNQGLYSNAGALYKRALVRKAKLLGLNYPDVLPTITTLGLISYIQGRHLEAETLLKRALIGQVKVLGPEHPDVLPTAEVLAALWCEQQRYPRAETLYKRVLAGKEKIFGPGHPKVLPTIEALADIFCKQGRHLEVEALQKKFNTTCSQLYSYRVPPTLPSRGNHLSS